jgi:glucose/arabinose dehydrogenase
MFVRGKFLGYSNRVLPFAMALGAIACGLQIGLLAAFCQTKNADLTEPTVKVLESPRRYEIKIADLPAPFATESARRSSRYVEQPKDAVLYAPKGFKVNVFAEGGFQNPRWLALAPNGDVFLADSAANKVIVLRDKNNDGRADERFTFAEGLTLPFGMAFGNGYLYVANTNSVVRFKYQNGQTQAAEASEKIIDLPGQGYNQHWTRNVIFSPDRKKLYVTVGSQSNVSVEPDARRAAISEYNPDGSGFRVFAGGLRNSVGVAFNSVTKQLWTTVNERDGLGDDLVPDYLTSVKDGAFYGWPFAYLGANEEPRRKGENPELVKKTVVPEVLFQAHSAALGLAFYDGKMFPKEYVGDAFVAFRGSWNRAKLTGYKIVRVRFKNGQPVGGYEDFLTGWLPDENSNEVWGRPVGLLVLPDGSLLITDDTDKKIWRVSYKK